MLLDLLDMINVIDRLSGWLLGLHHGGSHQIHFDRHAVLGEDAERMLADRGVKVSGRRVRSQDGIMSVPPQQARWADYILRRGAVPLTGKPIDPKNAGWASRHLPGHLPPAWKDRQK